MKRTKIIFTAILALASIVLKAEDVKEFSNDFPKLGVMHKLLHYDNLGGIVNMYKSKAEWIINANLIGDFELKIDSPKTTELFVPIAEATPNSVEYEKANTTLSLDDKRDFKELNASQSWLRGVQSFQLLRRNIGEEPYYISYLVASDDKNRVFVFAYIEDGIECEFEARDINGDGKTELLVSYSAGGNANVLRIYEIAETDDRHYEPSDIVEWKNSRVQSNGFGRKGLIVEDGQISVLEADYSSGEYETKKITYPIKGKTLIGNKNYRNPKDSKNFD